MSQQPTSANQLLTLPGPNDTEDAGFGAAPPPWWRRRGTIIGVAVVLLIILLGGFIFSLLNRKPPVTYQYQQVRMGDLSINVSATGPLTSSVYNLVFQGSGGVIQEIDVTQGQKVVKGQLIAKLDKTLLQDAYNQQLATVQSAQSNLGSAMDILAKTQGVASANNTAAQTAANGSQNNLNATTNTSNANNQSAQQNVNNAQNTLNATQNQSQANVNAAQTALNNAQQALNQARNTANASINQARATEQASLASCNGSSSTTTTTTSSSSATGTATPTTSTSTTTSTSSTSNSNAQNCRNQAQATFNAAVATANQNVQTAQATVNADQAALNTAQASANLSNTTAQNGVNSAQQGVNTTQAQGNQSNVAAQGTNNNNRAAINTTRANGASSLSNAQQAVIADQGQLQTAQAALVTAKQNLDNATLRAPHSGTVTTINGTVGSPPGLPQNASNTSTTTSGNTFVQIVDTNSLQVQANVNETDTANIKVGESATFTVNAYQNKTFRGTVSAISPNGQTVSNVVTYPVFIDVDKNSVDGANLIPGMTANVTISVIDRPNALLIPVDAVNFARLASSGSTTSTTPQLISPSDAASAMAAARQMLINLQNQRDVSADNPIPSYVLERGTDNKFIAKPVVLGLTDGTVYEVLDGLTTGDTIVVGPSTGNRVAPQGGGGPGGGG